MSTILHKKENHEEGDDAILMASTKRVAFFWLLQGDGLNIRKLRRSKDITLQATVEELRAIGKPISYRTLQAIETEQKNMISCENLFALADVLGPEVIKILDIRVAL